jgi:hypothetical protein
MPSRRRVEVKVPWREAARGWDVVRWLRGLKAEELMSLADDHNKVREVQLAAGQDANAKRELTRAVTLGQRLSGLEFNLEGLRAKMRKSSTPVNWGQEARQLAQKMGLATVPGATRMIEQAVQRDVKTQKAFEERLPGWWGWHSYRKAHADHTRRLKGMQAARVPAHFWPRFKAPVDRQFAGKRLEDLPAWYLDRLQRNRSLFRSLPGRQQKALSAFLKQQGTQDRLKAQYADPDLGPGGTRTVEGSPSWVRHETTRLWELAGSFDYDKKVRGDFSASLDAPTSRAQDFGRRRPTDYEYDPERREASARDAFGRVMKSGYVAMSTVTKRDLPKIPWALRAQEREFLEEYRQRSNEAELMGELAARRANPKEAMGSHVGPRQLAWMQERAQTLSEDESFGMSANEGRLVAEAGRKLRRQLPMHDVLGTLARARSRDELQLWWDEMDSSGFGPRWHRDLPQLARDFNTRWNAFAGRGSTGV